MLRGTVGLALGSGGARGFAHIGVLRGLLAAGIEPDVISGASAGAAVGAVYAAGALDDFEKWSRELDRRGVMSLLDVSLRGGALRGRRWMEEIGRFLPEGPMEESLGKRFGVVATDLETGREVWLREGPLLPALHASAAVPGVVSPVRIGERWLIDGGVVDPVPVALCRALGADTVIAVDLNAALLARRFRGEAARPAPPEVPAETTPGSDASAETTEASEASRTLQNAWAELRLRLVGPSEPRPAPGPPAPGLYDVLNNTLEIMQVRITRSRMAGDPPELLITPRLPDFTFLDFDRAAEAIEEGRLATQRTLAALARGEEA